jgi:XRE family transcriptional regulator, regulator of sulfur utilization
VTPDIAAIGGRVRDMRERVGYSAAGLARRAGVDAWTVRALENGTASGMTLATLSGLARAFGVPVGVLLGERPLPLGWPVGDVFWGQVRRELEQIREVA